MNRMQPVRFGLGVGIALALLNLGCAILMAVLPHDTAIAFFNSLTHGVDWTSVLRWNEPWWETIISIVEAFLLGWVLGAVVAAVHNFGATQPTASAAQTAA